MLSVAHACYTTPQAPHRLKLANGLTFIVDSNLEKSPSYAPCGESNFVFYVLSVPQVCIQ